MSKLRLRFSPYTYVRVAVMKSLLLGGSDYDRLLKMGYNEALRFIADSQYRKEIEEYKVGGEDPLMIEAALNANLMRVFGKLHQISDERMQKVVQMYLLRYDMENIKSIVRAKFAKLPAGAIEPLLFESVNNSRVFFGELLSKADVKQVLEALPFSSQLAAADPARLPSVENALDRYYVESLYAFARNLGGEGAPLADFLREEVDLVNINTLVQLRSLEEKERQGYLIAPSKLVGELLAAKSENDFAAVLRKQKKTSLRGDEQDFWQRLEVDLQVSLLKREALLMHQHTLSANQVVGFMLAKEIEVKNLKALLKGKLLGVDAAQLQSFLVVAK